MSKVTTKTEVRLSYTNLIEPRAQNEGDEPKFGTAILIPKSDTATVDAIKAAIKEAVVEGTAKTFGGKAPSNLKNPLRDGDTDRPDDEVYAGHFFINAKGPKGGKEQPMLLDKSGKQTDSASVIYSGVNARVSLQFYAFDVNGNKGIAAGLVSVLSSETGEPLGNTVTEASAAAEFGVVTPAGAAAAEFAGDKGESAPAEAGAAASGDDDDIWAKTP